MNDNERIQSIKERYVGADRDTYVEGQDIWFLLRQLEQRDKTIAEFISLGEHNAAREVELRQQNKEVRRQSERYDAYEADMAKFRQEYQVMLSALETIKTYERCGELHGQTCASIARDAITQVKGEQHG